MCVCIVRRSDDLTFLPIDGKEYIHTVQSEGRAAVPSFHTRTDRGSWIVDRGPWDSERGPGRLSEGSHGMCVHDVLFGIP